MDKSDIESINVWKADEAVKRYGKDGKDGVLYITTKKGKRAVNTSGSGINNVVVLDYGPQSNPIRIVKRTGNRDGVTVTRIDTLHPKPLLIVNGKIANEDAAKSLSPANITAINVLKDESATAIYGDAGRNGVILVTTKDSTITVK
jgi:TonB-dependent SusC/RagA subfamily outer membrane receptor